MLNKYKKERFIVTVKNTFIIYHNSFFAYKMLFKNSVQFIDGLFEKTHELVSFTVSKNEVWELDTFKYKGDSLSRLLFSTVFK